MIIFSIEYAVRLLTCHAVRQELLSSDVLLDMVLGDIPISFQSRSQRLFNFVLSPSNIIDAVAIVPWYLETFYFDNGGVNGTTVLRVIRLTRLFRLLKAAKYFEVLQIMGRVLNIIAPRRCTSGSSTCCFASAFLVSLIFFAEMGTWDAVISSRSPTEGHLAWYPKGYERINPLAGLYGMPAGVPERSPYRSIPQSFWWCVVTSTRRWATETWPPRRLGGRLSVRRP